MSDVVVTDNPARSRYEAQIGGQPAGHAAYSRRPGQIMFVHTVVQPAFEGNGVGGAIVRTSLDQARADGLSVIPQCPFYAGWIRRHPEYLDLVEPEYRAALTG